MALTKDMIALSVYERLEVPKSEAFRLVEFVLEKMKETLAEGEDVLISGFGKFSVRKKGRRKGRNPATGEGLMLDARKVVVFRSSPVLRGKVNGEDPM